MKIGEILSKNLFSFSNCDTIFLVMKMQKIVSPLMKWYQKEKRILPWRVDQNPYHVWVSEIMLQQTRIEAVIEYYYRFMEKLPTIFDLASCPMDELLKLWEGLGYYQRARNLQRAAQIIQEQYQGKFPDTYATILSLPGIGEYTASAISSICFQQKEVCVDGNVLRVFMRLQNSKEDISNPKVKKAVRERLTSIIDSKNPGDFNQAMMELGETICLPNGMPKCEICPIQTYCLSKQHHTQLELPIHLGKVVQKEEKYTIFLYFSQGKVLIQQRLEENLLSGLWQFPYLEGHLSRKKVEEFLQEKKISFSKIEKSISYTHVFTHKKWNMISYLIFLSEPTHDLAGNWVNLEELTDTYAIPTAFQPFKKKLEKKEGNKKC